MLLLDSLSSRVGKAEREARAAHAALNARLNDFLNTLTSLGGQLDGFANGLRRLTVDLRGHSNRLSKEIRRSVSVDKDLGGRVTRLEQSKCCSQFVIQ